MSEAVALVDALREAGLTVACAESLTGGAVSAAIVDVPGASQVFRGGIVAYATELKHDLVGVDAALLAEHGPVHPDVAAALAAGIRERCGADVGIGTTGVAGPDGQDGHPPGEVFVAVVHGTRSEVRGLQLPGDRAAVRGATVREALDLATEAVLAARRGDLAAS